MNLTSDIILIFIFLGFVAAAQFFRGRKLNLMIMEFTAKELENILKPKDKIYQWIGMYVGYKAVFKLLRKYLDRVEVTITLLPRQSLLYYPIALITSRFDKIFLIYCFSRLNYREAHIIRKGYYRRSLSKVIKGYEFMNKQKISIQGTYFYLIYEDANALDKLLRFVKTLANPSIVNHIAMVPKNRTLYIAAKLRPDNFSELVSKSLKLALSLT